MDGNKSSLINMGILPSIEFIEELFKSRRSIRKFQDRTIAKEKLLRICQSAKYSPTNSYDLELVVVTDQVLIKQLEEICLLFVRKAYRFLYSNNFIYNLLKRLIPQTINDIDRLKTKNTLERGSIFQQAPVLIFCLGDPRINYAELSCQYAIYNMIIVAQTLGIGSCISGAGKRILSKNKKARKLLSLKTDINQGYYPVLKWLE